MLAIIQEILQRINTRLSSSTMYIIIFVLSMFIGFFSGRVYSIDSAHEVPKLISKTSPNSTMQDAVYINNMALDSNVSNSNEAAQSADASKIVINKGAGRIYASSKGKKYYIEGVCDGNISVKNKVYYKSIASAVAAGKSRAAACH